MSNKYHQIVWVCLCLFSLAGCSPMLEAVRTGDVNEVRRLANTGVSVSDSDPMENLTPLQGAAWFGRLEVAKELIKYGANVNMGARDLLRVPPLTYAVISTYTNGSIEMVRLLLEKGANINAVDGYEGYTAIMNAVLSNRPQMVRVLLAHGASLDIKNKKGKTVIDLARENGNLAFFKYLSSPNQFLSYTRNKNKDIIIAVILSDPQKIKELISQGANVNAKDNEGETILMYAAAKGWLELVDLLIKKGVDVNAKDMDGWTAEMFARAKNNLDIANKLADSGAKKLYSGDLNRDLLIAVIFSDTSMIKSLLTKTVDVNYRYKLGNTPLMLATFKKDLFTVELLLRKNADLNLRNDFEYSPLLIACIRGYTDIANALLDKGADLSIQNRKTPLLLAVLNRHPDIVSILIKHGANDNITSEDDETLLILAISKGYPEIAELLLPVSNVNAKDKNGRTVLMYAVEKGYLSLVQALLNKGAIVDYDTIELAKKKGYVDFVDSQKPEVINRYMSRAEAAVENAKSNSDYQLAIEEYEKVKKLTGGTSPEVYYNLGFIYDQVGRYDEAIKNLKKCLELSPKAADAETIKKLIYKLEYKNERK